MEPAKDFTFHPTMREEAIRELGVAGSSIDIARLNLATLLRTAVGKGNKDVADSPFRRLL